MSFPKDLLREHPGVGEAFLHGYRGSIAHGTYEPNDDPNSFDDKDTMAFYVAPIECYFGLSSYGSQGTREIVRDPWDIVVYEARKALKLLGQGNPNVLAMLWLPENLYIRLTPAGEHLLEHKHLFVGKHVFNPFVGYAKSQFYKMENGAHEGYMGEKRKQLVEQHGYDTKNAAHLIRLMRQCIEFLNTGELEVVRHDSRELLEIKHGAWPLEKVKDEADRLFKRAEDAYDRSKLPARPDREAVEQLCVRIVQSELLQRSL